MGARIRSRWRIKTPKLKSISRNRFSGDPGLLDCESLVRIPVLELPSPFGIGGG